MPVFFILIFIGLIALWFLVSFLYKPIGKFFHRIYKDAINEINDNKEQNNNE